MIFFFFFFFLGYNLVIIWNKKWEHFQWFLGIQTHICFFVRAVNFEIERSKRWREQKWWIHEQASCWEEQLGGHRRCFIFSHNRWVWLSIQFSWFCESFDHLSLKIFIICFVAKIIVGESSRILDFKLASF